MTISGSSADRRIGMHVSADAVCGFEAGARPAVLPILPLAPARVDRLAQECLGCDLAFGTMPLDV